MTAFHSFFDIPKFDYEAEKAALIENLEMLRNMSEQERTLYKKWIEVKYNYRWAIDLSMVVKAQIWQPRNLQNPATTADDLARLDPVLEFVPSDDSAKCDQWLMLRVFCHTLEFVQNPGRFMRFLVRDRGTGKYLGAVSLASDMMLVGARERHIQWDGATRVKRLNHLAAATCVMATQPFGFNFLGGKLVASLLCDGTVGKLYEELYGDVLVGITTTSLYGHHSMYQRIPYWKELGETVGRTMLKPDDSFYDRWHDYIRETYPEEYTRRTLRSDGSPATTVKQRIIFMALRDIGIVQSNYKCNVNRGVFFAPLYANTNAFLRGEVTKSDLLPHPRLSEGRDGILAWWRAKAERRYQRLLDEDRLNDDVLYYNRMVNMSWEAARLAYLGDVGR